MTIRPIGLILDTSAIAAYGRALVAVGETIGEVMDHGAAVGLQIACLAEADASDTSGRVVVLARHPAAVVLPLPAEAWAPLAAAVGLLGSVGPASALLAAEAFDCDI